MKNLKYQIGNFVVVSKIQMRDKQGSAVTWRKCLCYIATASRLGQVVGLCIRFDGYMSRNDAFFIPTKSHQFWLVRFGLTNRAVEVAEEDMRLAVGDYELPYRWPVQKMSDRNKQYLREDSKNWPRDARGRWVAGPVVKRN